MLTDNDLKSYIRSYYQDRKITYTKLDKHDRAIGVLLEENKRLNNIIKEVREYIEEHIKYECDGALNGMQFYSHHLYGFSKKEILEILDKMIPKEELSHFSHSYCGNMLL